jgi:hypothetical protein
MTSRAQTAQDCTECSRRVRAELQSQLVEYTQVVKHPHQAVGSHHATGSSCWDTYACSSSSSSSSRLRQPGTAGSKVDLKHNTMVYDYNILQCTSKASLSAVTSAQPQLSPKLHS